jgi:hypothetical protein
MKQKIGALFLSVFMFSLMFSTFVSAQSTGANIATDINNFLTEFAKGASPVLNLILGDTPTGDLMIVKFLFLIILISVLYYATRKIPNLGTNSGVVWTITIVGSILAVRYLTTEEIVNFLLLPTGVIGISLLAVIPFIIYFFFIESFGSVVVRKVGWAVWVVIYVGMALTRWNDLAPTATGSGINFNLGWLSLILILIDSRVKSFFLEFKSKELRKADIDIQLAKIRSQITELEATKTQIDTEGGDTSRVKKRIENFNKAKIKLLEDLTKL